MREIKATSVVICSAQMAALVTINVAVLEIATNRSNVLFEAKHHEATLKSVS